MEYMVYIAVAACVYIIIGIGSGKLFLSALALSNYVDGRKQERPSLVLLVLFWPVSLVIAAFGL